MYFAVCVDVRLTRKSMSLSIVDVRLSFLSMRLVFYSFFLLLSEKEHTYRKDGELWTQPDVLSVEPMVKEGGWTLAAEDPNLFLDSKLDLKARREWPDEPYPQPAVPVAPTGDTPFYKESDMAEFLKIHHQYTQLILGMGVDPCAKFQESKVINILAKIKAKDLECPVCAKVYKSTSRMRQHVALKHLGKTPYQCGTCKKYYVNQQSLTAHGSTHDSNKNPHKCNVCSKAFPTEAQLRSHNPVHGEPMYICQYANCGRKYKWLKGKKEHEEKCKKNPDAKPKYGCDLCDRRYWDKRSLDRHVSEDHTEGVVRLPCPSCSKTFKNKNSLAKHKKNVHDKKKAVASKSSKDPEEEEEEDTTEEENDD